MTTAMPNSKQPTQTSAAAGVPAGLPLVAACEDIWFVDQELDEAIDEMALTTTLPREVQRAAMGRAMLCLSLAASVGDEESFSAANGELLRPLAEFATLVGVEELASCVGAMLRHGAAQIEREMAGLPEFAGFRVRVDAVTRNLVRHWSLH